MLVLLSIGFEGSCRVHSSTSWRKPSRMSSHLAHAYVHFVDFECCSSFSNLPFGNFNAFYCLRIGEMDASVNSIRVFFRQEAVVFVKHAFGELDKFSSNWVIGALDDINWSVSFLRFPNSFKSALARMSPHRFSK